MLDPDDPLADTPYRALRPLGEGGTSEALEAEHRQLGYRVVVKLLHAEHFLQFKLKDRMEREAYMGARLRHDNLVRVLGWGETRALRTYIVMEQLHGRTLRDELIERVALPPAEAASVAAQALAGLSAAHAAGLVHRDVKPENLFLCDLPGGGRRVKVLDFGYAKLNAGAAELRASAPHVATTTEGMVVGTPHYYSPEQIEVGRDVDARADVYAMGCVLYTMLAGRPPFAGKIGAAIARAHLEEEPPPLRVVSLHPIPEELFAAVMRALEKRREDRFPSAEAFRAELLHLSVA